MVNNQWPHRWHRRNDEFNEGDEMTKDLAHKGKPKSEEFNYCFFFFSETMYIPHWRWRWKLYRVHITPRNIYILNGTDQTTSPACTCLHNNVHSSLAMKMKFVERDQVMFYPKLIRNCNVLGRVPPSGSKIEMLNIGTCYPNLLGKVDQIITC